MAELGILQLGNPILTTPTRPLDLPDEADEARRIIGRLTDMADRVQDRFEFLTGAMGIAAPQIGEDRSIAIFRPTGGRDVVLINPEILGVSPQDRDDWEETSEGCLSFYDFRFWFSRPRVAVIEHARLSGERVATTFRRGRHARDVLHEVDHLNGVLCLHHVPRGLRNVSLE